LAPGHEGPGYYARRELATGRLPNGEGFGIWAQRWRFHGKDYVQLIASIAPAGGSLALIRRRLESGQFGEADTDVNEMTAPVALQGVVGCSKRPVVLLYGMLHSPATRAVLTTGVQTRPLALVPIPTDLRVAGVLGYGFLPSAAKLELRSRSGEVISTEYFPGPPPQRGCGGGASSISYGFASR